MSRPFWWLILLAVCFWSGAAFVSPHAQPEDRPGQELMYYPSGKFVKEASLGYSQAATALTWLRAVQYYGEHAKSDLKFDLLYHVCDVITDLDPKFTEPYTFGAFVLMTEGKRPEDGMKLLEKGRRENPDNWRLFFETGFMYYIAWEDYAKAAEYFSRAAEMPGAPERTERFAAWVTYRAGEMETSLVMWQQLAERTTNPELQKKAQEKIAEITAVLEQRQ